MLLREAEAAFGEEGGEVLLMTQGGDGERDGERPRVGLLLGLCRGEKAWSIRPLRSWNICFCKSKVKRCSVSTAQRGRLGAGRGCTVPLTRERAGSRSPGAWLVCSAVLMMTTWSLHASFYLSWATPSVGTPCVLAWATQGGLPLSFLHLLVILLSPKVTFPPEHPIFQFPQPFLSRMLGRTTPLLLSFSAFLAFIPLSLLKGGQPGACQVLAATSPASWSRHNPNP